MNIVLLSIDCLRYDRCGFDGYHRNTTPVLDELASEAVVYDNAYATGPYTTESFPGILAGQHSHNGSFYGDTPAWKTLTDGSETLARTFQRAGYQTTARISNPHLSGARGFDQGFDKFENLRIDHHSETSESEQGGSALSGIQQELRKRMRGWDSLINPFTLPFLVYRSLMLYRSEWPTLAGETILQGVAQRLATAETDTFHWSHLMDIHAPIHPKRVNDGGLETAPAPVHFLADMGRAAQIETPRYGQLYDGAVRYVDTQIGRFVERLKSAGVWDETVVILTADHGEALFDRDGRAGHGRHDLHDELLHVPLLVRIPGIDGRRVETPVSLAWLHEIATEAVGIDDGEYPATSGLESLLDPGGEPETVFSDAIDERGHSVAVRDDRHKVITSYRLEGADVEYSYHSHPIELDYRQDPRETHERPVSRSALQREAESVFRTPTELRSEGEGFSSQMEQRLQDLGYKM